MIRRNECDRGLIISLMHHPYIATIVSRNLRIKLDINHYCTKLIDDLVGKDAILSDFSSCVVLTLRPSTPRPVLI